MSSELQVMQEPQTSTTALVLDSGNLEKMMSVANIMATSKVTVPKHLQNNSGDCLAVVMQAMQWKMNPFAVAQKTHLVNGTLGYEAQLVNAVVQSSGAIAGRFHYEYQGDGSSLECRVGAVISGEKEITWGEWLKSSDVKVKNSPLWATNPKQQMGYLQIKNWARLYCPGSILGVYTADELDPTLGAAPNEKDVTPRQEIPENPPYPDSKMEENLHTWREAIVAGKNTAEGIIAKINSRYTLNQTQIDSIKAQEKPVVIEGELIPADEQGASNENS